MSGARASPHPLFYDTVFFRAVALFADAIIYNVVPYLYLLSIPVMGLMASATFGKFLDADKIGCRKFVSINVLLLALCPSLHRAAHNFFLGADAPLLSVAAITVQLLVWLTCSRVFATSLCYGYALLHVLRDRGANSGFAATAFRDALCQQRGQALGRRVCIVGNGPSVVRKEGQAPLGDCIDHFDEVLQPLLCRRWRTRASPWHQNNAPRLQHAPLRLARHGAIFSDRAPAALHQRPRL